jgi:hypothetical protein
VTSLSIAPRPGEPLAAWFSPERRDGAALASRFECASFGDRVCGRSWRPDAAPVALVLALHDLARDTRDPALSAAAAVWARRGAATAAIDLPLHGERHNAKLSRRAVAARTQVGSPDGALWQGLVAQAVRDLARALDALATRGPVPPVTCVAFGEALPIALAYGELDARVVRIAALGGRPDGAGDRTAHAAKPLAWLERPDDLSLAP